MAYVENNNSAVLYYLKDLAMSDPEVKRFFTGIGRQLKILRGCRRISAEIFIKEMGITAENLDKIEAGEIWVEPAFYGKAAKVCGMTARIFIDSISAHELPGVLSRHRGLILASLTDQDRINFQQYNMECINAAKQPGTEERKMA